MSAGAASKWSTCAAASAPSVSACASPFSPAGAGGLFDSAERPAQGLEGLAPFEFAARLREQMHAGSMAAGHEQGIALDVPGFK